MIRQSAYKLLPVFMLTLIVALAAWGAWQGSHCDKGDLHCLKRKIPPFGQKFVRHAPLFLTPQNANSLFIYIPDAKQRKAIAESINRLAAPALAINRHRHPRPPVTCAVVGNSPNLQQSGYGREIDAHTYVYRMNNVPVGGPYAEDVGNKTVFHALHSGWGYVRGYGPHTTTLLLLGNFGAAFRNPNYLRKQMLDDAMMLKEMAAQFHPRLFSILYLEPEREPHLGIMQRWDIMYVLHGINRHLATWRNHAMAQRLIVTRFTNFPDANTLYGQWDELDRSLIAHMQFQAAWWYPEQFAMPKRYFQADYLTFPDNLRSMRGGVRIMHPDFLYGINSRWFQPKRRPWGAWPSTGFKTLVLAMHMCDRVDVYGFGGTNARGRWEHYNGTKPNLTGGHMPDYQNVWLQGLAKRGIVIVHEGTGAKVYTPPGK